MRIENSKKKEKYLGRGRYKFFQISGESRENNDVRSWRRENKR